MKNSIKVIILFLILVTTGVVLAMNREGLIEVLKKEKECTPYNMLVEKGKGEIRITWDTKDSCTGIVKFGSGVEDLEHWLSSKVENEKNTVVIDTGSYSDVNYFVIISNGELYGLEGKAIAIN
ncbi:hypothetical protein HYV12_04155 [Candidatus Dojkabacteria bacterium]|nr:hypothetical protein [Candidatus Dojkabacteria bacterium]